MSTPPKQRRDAEVLFPPNVLKQKAGSGGLDEAIINAAQSVIDNNDVDFTPIGQRFLAALKEGIKMCRSQRGKVDNESLLATLIYPAMQLKANGGMFKFPLVSEVAAKLIGFLECAIEPDEDVLRVVQGFAESLQAILMLGEQTSEMSEHGDELSRALNAACQRYFDKHKDD